MQNTMAQPGVIARDRRRDVHGQGHHLYGEVSEQ